MQILNTVGVAKKLGCSENWIHKLVAKGRIKAHVYGDDGILIEHNPGDPKQGQGLYFLEDDLKAYQPHKRGRPMGAKDKQKRSKQTT